MTSRRASGRGLTASTHVLSHSGSLSDSLPPSRQPGQPSQLSCRQPGHEDWSTAIHNARRSVREQTTRLGSTSSSCTQHLINRNYRCKRCHFYTTKSKVFLYHQKQFHGDNINIYPCDLCDYASRYKCKVLRHRKFVHAGAKDLDPADVMEESGTVQTNGHTEALDLETVKEDLKQEEEHIKRGVNQENLDLNGNEMVASEGSPEPSLVLEETATPLVDATSNPLDNLRESPAPHGQMTFHCKLCSFSDSQKWKAVNHIKSSHMKEKLFKCPFCTFATGSKIEYCIHKTKHSTKQFSCDECSFTSISKESYDQHIASHKTEGAIKCRLCSYTSDEESAMQIHMQEAHPLADINEMAAAYQVKLEPEDLGVDSSPPSTPPMVALAKLAAQDHLPSQTSPGLAPETDVSCPVCGLVLKSDAKLRIHMVSHTQESAHRCPLCTLKYKRSSDLNRHMKKKHGIRLRDFMMGEQDEPLNLTIHKTMNDLEDEQPLDLSCKRKVPIVSQNGENLKCNHCTYVAKWPSDLHRHMLVHSVEKRYQCTYCHRRYKYKFDLNMHIRKIHHVPAGRVKLLPGDDALGTLPDDEEEEEEEEDRDEDREYMSSPSPIHSPGSPMSESNSYCASPRPSSANCITPLKPAAAEKLLKSPRQLQLGPASKFRCEYCPYYGACRSEVDRHLRLHTGEKPYSCLFCSYKSHWKGDMKRHIQKHHPEELKTEEDIINIMVKAYQPENAFDHITAGQIEIKPIVGSLKPSLSPTRATSECSSDSSGAPPNMVVGANGEMLPSGVKSSNGSVDGSPKKNMCPYCPFVCEAPSKLKCHMEIHENLKRFKCPHCGKRSNWTWDVRKHIKKEHPGMDLNVIVLPEEEARSSLGDYLQQQQTRMQSSDFMRMPPSMVARRTLDFPHEYMNSEDYSFDEDASRSGMSDFDMDDSRDNMDRMDLSESNISVYDSLPKTGRYRPYKCSKCGRRSNWKWDLRKHIRTSHPDASARMIIMSEDEARASWPPEKPINFDLEETRKVITPRPEPIPSSQQQVLQQVDTKRLKRFKCALCPYRSNYRSDIGRHTKRLHRKMPFKVIILDEDEAENTLEAYKDTFGHKKFVLSPAKNKIAARMKAAQMRHQMSAMDSDSLSQPPEVPRYDSPSHSITNMDDSLVNDLDMPEDDVIEEEEQPQPGGSMDNDGITKVKVWKCSLCEFRDRDKQVVMNHLRTHPRTKIFRCKLCGDTSDYRNSIYRHIRNRHATTDYMTSVEEIPVNQRENTDDNGTRSDGASWRCTLCGHVADCKSAIIRHCGEEHPDHELTAAMECMQNGDDSDVRMEVDDEVPEGVEVPDLVPRQNVGSFLGSSAAKHLACNVCPYRTNKSGLLKIHKTYHKLQPGNRFKCKYCPYYVSAMRLLHQHVRLHLQQRGQTHSSGDPGTRIPDEEEDPGQQREGDLDLGDGSLKGSKHCCDQCPFICRNKNDFIYHKQFHRQKASAPFKCHHCPYWVGQKRLLRQHERVHSPSYSIKINGSAFSQSSLGSPAKSDASDYGDSMDIASLKLQIINSKITSCPITPDKFTPLDDNDEDDEEGKMEIDETENDERITMPGYVVNEEGQLLKSGLLKKLHKCSKCPYTNIRAANLKLHEAMHEPRPTKEDDDIFSCQFCTYGTVNKKLLSQHIKVHSQQYEPGKDEIIDFEKADDAVEDADEVTNDDQPLELTKKSSDAETKVDGLPGSKRPQSINGPRVESGQLPADYYVKYNENSGEHILERVSVHKKFSCEKCPYITMTCLNFERHALLHGCKQRFTCEFCDYSVPTFQLLLEHKKLHMMPNPNLLSMQSASNLTKLPEISADVAAAANFPANKEDPVSTDGVQDKVALYENSEEFVEPKKLYRCDRCPFTNTRRDNLLAHLKFHMVRSALQCSYCDYSVSKQHLLTQHMKVHFNSDGQFKSPGNNSAPATDIDTTAADNSKPKDNVKPGSDDAKKNAEKPKNGDNSSDDNQPEYIDLSELPTLKEDDNNNGEDSGKENKGQNQDQGQTEVKGDDSPCVCQYCDRTFQSSEKKQKHEMQHLVGKKY